MANFAQQIEEAAHGQEIIAVVIGAYGWYGFDEDDDVERDVPVRRGEVLDWATARPMLDYRHDTGYGAPECDAVYAWTADWVILVGTYDGGTWLRSVPRNPVACRPEMVGG